MVLEGVGPSNARVIHAEKGNCADFTKAAPIKPKVIIANNKPEICTFGANNTDHSLLPYHANPIKIPSKKLASPIRFVTNARVALSVAVLQDLPRHFTVGA